MCRMSAQQTEVQRLADWLEGVYPTNRRSQEGAAKELRRLEAENEQLKESREAFAAHAEASLQKVAELEAQLEAVEKQRDQLQQAGQQALEALQVLCDEYGRQMTAMNHKTPRRAKWTAALSAISALSQALESDHVEHDRHMVQQAEPVYQMQRADGSWVDQDKQASDYNASHGWPTRIVYTRTQPAQQPTHWISDTSVCGSPHTVSNEMYQRGRKAGAYEGYTRVFADPQPVQQPLTDEQIEQDIGPDEGDREAVTKIVRQVERAHRIGVQA